MVLKWFLRDCCDWWRSVVALTLLLWLECCVDDFLFVCSAIWLTDTPASLFLRATWSAAVSWDAFCSRHRISVAMNGRCVCVIAYSLSSALVANRLLHELPCFLTLAPLHTNPINRLVLLYAATLRWLLICCIMPYPLAAAGSHFRYNVIAQYLQWAQWYDLSLPFVPFILPVTCYLHLISSPRSCNVLMIRASGHSCGILFYEKRRSIEVV